MSLPRHLPSSLVLSTLGALAVLLGGCFGDDGEGGGAPEDAPETVRVTSDAFGDGERIPDKHTCVGANVKPPIVIEDLPDGTGSVALIMEDPDTSRGTITHHTVWDIPPTDASWPEGSDLRARGAKEGTAYRGPCPPEGDDAHRYFFRVYALEGPLDLPPGASRAALDDALAGNVLARGTLMGTYSREVTT